MTREETIALWERSENVRSTKLKEGKSQDDAHEAAKSIWNSWASDMLKLRSTLEESSQFHTKKDNPFEGYVAPETFSADTPTLEWMRAAQTNFSGFVFDTKPNFRGFIFPGQAWFGESSHARRERKEREVTIFSSGARFSEAVFCMDAVFDRAEFCQNAGFRDAVFRGIARFDECKFKDAAWFIRASFLDDVWFGQCEFDGFTNFANATFQGNCSFSGSRCNGAFALNEAFFAKVPDFTQTAFLQAPRLDNVSLPTLGFFPGLTLKEAVDTQATYRAVRRLAISAHDHENELKAFKGEIRVRRGTVDKPWHATYWLGVVYDALSDFGRSMMRPFYIWLLSVAAFTAAYLANAGKFADYTARCTEQKSDTVPNWENALALSVKNALVFAGADKNFEQQYKCLYGDVVLVTSTFIQMTQTLCSAILIFLFLLAVRNQFKIK